MFLDLMTTELSSARWGGGLQGFSPPVNYTSNEVTNLQGRSVRSDGFFMGFYKILVPSVQFLFHRW
jgi:hypothetical protein